MNRKFLGAVCCFLVSCKSAEEAKLKSQTEVKSTPLSSINFIPHSGASLWIEASREDVIKKLSLEFNKQTSTWIENPNYAPRPVTERVTMEVQEMMDKMDAHIRSVFPEQTKFIPKPKIIISDGPKKEADAVTTSMPICGNGYFERPGTEDGILELQQASFGKDGINFTMKNVFPLLCRKKDIEVGYLQEYLKFQNNRENCKVDLLNDNFVIDKSCEVIDLDKLFEILPQLESMSEEEGRLLYEKMAIIKKTVRFPIEFRATANQILMDVKQNPNLEKDIIKRHGTLAHELTHYYRTHPSSLIDSKFGSSTKAISILDYDFVAFPPQNNQSYMEKIDIIKKYQNQGTWYQHQFKGQQLRSELKKVVGKNKEFFNSYIQCKPMVQMFDKFFAESIYFKDFPEGNLPSGEEERYLKLDAQFVSCFKSIQVHDLDEIRLETMFGRKISKGAASSFFDLAKDFSRKCQEEHKEFEETVEDLVKDVVIEFTPEVDAELYSIVFYKPLGYDSVVDMVKESLLNLNEKQCVKNIEDFMANRISEKELLTKSFRENPTKPLQFLNAFDSQFCPTGSAKIVMARKLGLI